jgi:amino acid transporter
MRGTMATTGTSHSGTSETFHLKRDIGLLSLTFVSLGSIIGSGWLLGALYGAEAAGPASLISWILGAGLLSILALVHAELGAAYPVAGGTARFPNFAFGTLAGFTAGWAAYLQAVTIAPIEVEASLTYLDNIGWVHDHLNLLHPATATLTPSGIFWATLLMLFFTVINIMGVKVLAESNTITVLWKIAVPVLTVIVLISISFHPSNFTSAGGFMPFGMHGVFAALPAGLIFAMQGFEQAIQMGGEARDPQRDISRAVMIAMASGAALYIALEVAFIGGLNPLDLTSADSWAHPLGNIGDFGPYATIATAAGAAWLAKVLYIDAFISPAGTGLLYIGTSSRLSYAVGRERTAPKALAYVSRRGVPLYSILLAFVIGEFCFLPFPSWQSLVGLVTSATAIMYAYAPVSLTALRRNDAGRERPYRLPAPAVMSPIAFIAANLIIYWSGFEATWKLLIAMCVGLVLFALTRLAPSANRPPVDLRGAIWVGPWLVGMTIIGYFGRYGKGARGVTPGKSWALPEWWDLITVCIFCLIIFYWAVTLRVNSEHVGEMVEAEEEEIRAQPELNVA